MDNKDIQDQASAFRDQKQKEDPNSLFTKALPNLEDPIKRLDQAIWKDIKIKFASRQNNEAIQAIADKLTEENTFLTIASENSDTRDQIYLYDNGLYIPNGREFIRTALEAELGEYAKTFLISEIIAKISRKTLEKNKDIFAQTDKNLIAFNNGIYDLSKGEFTGGFSPQYKFLTKISTDYNAKAKCPKILNFLSEVAYEEDIPLIQEWLGFILHRDYLIKKALIIVGERDTGKTTFLNITDKLIGRRNISSVSLQSLSGDRFASATLHSKLLNSFDDLSFQDISATGNFKMLTGNSIISAQKKFGDVFLFNNHAKLQYACNKIPSVKDIEDMAYFARWLLLKFDNVQDKPNRNLLAELTTPEELSGLLNWAIEGLQRLLSNGDFSYSKTPEQVKVLMQMSCNPIFAFVFDAVKKDPNAWTSKKETYLAYAKYCEANQLSIMTQQKFSRNFVRYFVAEETEHNKVKGWQGVVINKQYKVSEEDLIKDNSQTGLKIGG